MKLVVRPGRPQDREALLRLVNRKTYESFPIRGLSGHSQKIQRLSLYRAQWPPVLLAWRGRTLKGFLVVRAGRVDDYWGADGETLAALLAAVEGELVAELAACEFELFRSLGFVAEVCVVARACQAWEPPAESPWRVRPAGNDDRLMIMHLNAISLPVTAPVGCDLETLTTKFMNYYNKISLENNPELLILVLQKGRRDAGFLVVQRGYPNADLAFVFDIAIESQYQGQGAAQHLVNSGGDAAFREGFSALIGDISAGNSKALKTAVQGLGFVVERERWRRPVR